MKYLKCYVGIDSRFVMCEKFPNDEEHSNLNEMLEEFMDDNDKIIDVKLNQGFYDIQFEVISYTDFNPLKQDTDAYLEIVDIKKHKKINK